MAVLAAAVVTTSISVTFGEAKSKRIAPIIECVNATNIATNEGMQGYSGGTPAAFALIQIQGTPGTTGSTAQNADIMFYPDGDHRIIAPFYSSPAKQIRMFCPISRYDSYLSMLKSGKKVSCYFISPTVGTPEAYLRVTD